MPTLHSSLGAWWFFFSYSYTRLIGWFCSSFGKVGKEEEEGKEEESTSLARQEREAETSDTENTRAKKVKLVPEASRFQKPLIQAGPWGPSLMHSHPGGGGGGKKGFAHSLQAVPMEIVTFQ